MDRVTDEYGHWRKPMHVPVSVSTFTAISGLLVVSLATLIDASSGQNSIFSEAQAYEHFMGRWSRKLAPLLVRFAGVRDADTVLDVGSGTGALTAAVAKVAPSSRIVGIDPSASYVAFAQSQHGSRRVLFEVGDAQHMRFDDAMFDRTLSLLVVNFIPDGRKALGEMTRVTKPKGTVAAAVWDYGEGMEMLRAFWDEASRSHRRTPRRTSATCRSAAAAISRRCGAGRACRTSSKRR